MILPKMSKIVLNQADVECYLIKESYYNLEDMKFIVNLNHFKNL